MRALDPEGVERRRRARPGAPRGCSAGTDRGTSPGPLPSSGWSAAMCTATSQASRWKRSGLAAEVGARDDPLGRGARGLRRPRRAPLRRPGHGERDAARLGVTRSSRRQPTSEHARRDDEPEVAAAAERERERRDHRHDAQARPLRAPPRVVPKSSAAARRDRQHEVRRQRVRLTDRGEDRAARE